MSPHLESLELAKICVVARTFDFSSKQKGKERPGDFWHELVTSSYKMSCKEM